MKTTIRGNHTVTATDMIYFPEHRVALAVQVNTSVGRSLGKPLSRILVEAMEMIAAKGR